MECMSPTCVPAFVLLDGCALNRWIVHVQVLLQGTCRFRDGSADERQLTLGVLNAKLDELVVAPKKVHLLFQAYMLMVIQEGELLSLRGPLDLSCPSPPRFSTCLFYTQR